MKKREMRIYTDRRIYQGDNYLDIQIFPKFSKAGARGRKCRPTRAMQQKLNRDNSTYRLTRLANHNFKKGDYALHLTYDDMHLPADEEAAKKDIQNFIRRLKRIYKKTGIELKYIYVAAMGKKSGRIHFHMILSGGVRAEDITEAWGKGYAHITALRFGKEGIAGFSKYFILQDKIFYRTWSASKNLIKPENEDARIRADIVSDFYEEYKNSRSHSVIESYYPGYEVVSIYADRNDVVGGVYIQAKLCRKAGRYCTGSEEERQISLFDIWDV